jgi:hypothetical protein
MRKMNIVLVGVLLLVLAGLLPVSAPRADEEKSDFALLDQEPTVQDVSVQCGASMGHHHAKRQAFTMHITMTNRGDSGLGGTNGFVRVTYHDTDFVDYAIQVGTTVQITLAGGGTPGVDDIIKVTSQGGAVLIGQASLITDEDAKPHPLLDGHSFCTTTANGHVSPI